MSSAGDHGPRLSVGSRVRWYRFWHCWAVASGETTRATVHLLVSAEQVILLFGKYLEASYSDRRP